MRSLSDPDLIAVLLSGSNRAGKTDAGAQIAVATAAGRGESWVQAWMRLNDIPETLIPPHPSRVWVSALSFSDALEYQRPKLDKYLPDGTKRSRWKMQDQATATLPNGGVVVSKTEAQGRDKFQGASVPLIWLDEEHSQAIFEECLARTVDTQGIILLTMTPLKGITWPHKFFLKNPADGYTSRVIIGLDNPHVSSRAQQRRYAALSDSQRAARLLGKWTAPEGAVHPEWDRNRHTCEPFDIPADWPRFGSIDFGYRAPFSHIWGALSPDDILYIYRSHYQAGARLKVHAEAIHRAEGCPDCYPFDVPFGGDEWQAWSVSTIDGTGCETCDGTGYKEEMSQRWADPADKGSRMTLNSEYDLPTASAPKDKQAGFDALFNRMRAPIVGIQIFRDCTDVIEEFETLLWDEGKRDEYATKGADHAHDAIRYMCLGLIRSGYTGDPMEEEEES
ncbi:MAG: terminase family protein [Myxococcota bacterium]